MSDDVYDLLKIAAEELIAQNTELKSDLASAREDLEHITQYGTEEINAAVELRQKLAQALIERDEALTTIEDAKRALNATEEGILLAAMRVKEERDEAREKAERYRLEANAMMMQRDEAREEASFWHSIWQDSQ